YYEPMLFTHLNAPWEPYLSGPQAMIGNLVYPASNALARVTVLPPADPIAAMAAVRQYVSEGWGAKRIKQEITQGQTWARARGVTLMCTEFGALRVGPDAVSRQQWLSDTRSGLQSAAIGWTVWDYADVFGIATASNGRVIPGDQAIVPADPRNPQRQFDSRVLRALGLMR
ncbi:hypothetical protein, partial [uncultured Thiodictyon sp.]|uniref:hypothetical protein n=1 Tax=uncultured Thiodictyon sp. TaxID=1846217 RepID=UPI002600355E